MLFTSCLLNLFLAINTNPVAPDMVYQNRYEFTSWNNLPSVVGLDDDGYPFQINNTLGIGGLLMFNSPNDISVRLDKWYFNTEYYQCTYDGMVNQYVYNLVDGNTHTFDFFMYSGIDYDDSNFFQSLSELSIEYWVSYDSDDIYHSFRFWSNRDEVLFSDSYSLSQGYFLEKISNGLDISFNVNGLVNEVIDFVNGVTEGGYSYDSGYEDGSRDGYEQGYQDGLTDGADMDETTLAVWNGILSVGLVPINFFLAIFNFEILGINITSFVMSLLSVCIVIILLRLIFGGKSSSSGS